MQICVGMAGVQPSEYWNCSPKEVYAIITGFTEFNTSPKEKPMGREELDNLMELYPD